MTILIQVAFAAGYNAATENKRRAPCTCRVWDQIVTENCKGKELGASLPFSKAWLAGYDTQVNEECAKILAS